MGMTLSTEVVDAIDWTEGCAEPWIADILAALVRASRARSVLETGGFMGFTSKRLARALTRDAELVVCEIDPARAALVQAALEVERPLCEWRVVCDDVLVYVNTLASESLDFVWVDDAHEQAHVAQEINALLPKVRQRGIIAFHDVHGACALHEVLARYPNTLSLDLPRLGPAGGLGLLQVP